MRVLCISVRFVTRLFTFDYTCCVHARHKCGSHTALRTALRSPITFNCFAKILLQFQKLRAVVVAASRILFSLLVRQYCWLTTTTTNNTQVMLVVVGSATTLQAPANTQLKYWVCVYLIFLVAAVVAFLVYCVVNQLTEHNGFRFTTIASKILSLLFHAPSRVRFDF